MCLDTHMIFVMLIVLAVLCVICLTTFVLVLKAFVSWAGARQKRRAAEESLEPLPAANAGSISGL